MAPTVGTRDTARILLTLLSVLAACGGRGLPHDVSRGSGGAPPAARGTGSRDASVVAPTKPQSGSGGVRATPVPIKDAGRPSYQEWPTGCIKDPGGLTDEYAIGLTATEDPSVSVVLDDQGVYDVTITPETRTLSEDTWPRLEFTGPTSRGPHGQLSIAVGERFTTADLRGQTVTIKGAYQVLSCVEGQGAEASVMSFKALRDKSGKLLMISAPSTPTEDDGHVFFEPSVVPEISVRWVATPNEACAWRRWSLELTVVKTGQKTIGTFERRAELEMDGQTYVLATDFIVAPASKGFCGYADWILYSKDFLMRIPGVPDPQPESPM